MVDIMAIHIEHTLLKMIMWLQLNKVVILESRKAFEGTLYHIDSTGKDL